MSQLNVVKNSVSSDQIYFDITVTNAKSTTTTPPIFYYNESRTIPFLNKPEDYYLTIQRFTIDSGTLPVFIPIIQGNQPNINLTIYSVTLTFTLSTGATSVQQVFIEWVPQDKSANLPTSPNDTDTRTQDNSTGYYFCYSYSYFTALVFKAYVQAFKQLETACSADPNWTLAGTPTHPPVINWDTTSGQGTMYGDVFSYNEYSIDPITGLIIPNPYNIKVYMNAPLYSLYGSLPAEVEGYVGVLNGENFRILFVDIGGTNLIPIQPMPPVPPATTAPFYYAIQIYQEYETIANWTPIVALVFCSNTLPVTPNWVSTPIVYNDENKVQFQGNNSAQANIVTDLVTDSGLYKSFLVYEPKGQYRMITLNGNRPLYNIDLQVFWRDRFGGLNPVRIPSGGSVTIKLSFLKKGTIAV